MRAEEATLERMAPSVTAGDAAAEAWEAAVRAHGRMLYRVAYGVLRHPADAEDAVQEALTRAWRYRARLVEVERPAAWLARIVWRVALQRRPRGHEVALSDSDELPARHQISAEELASRREMRQMLEQLIPRLPRKLREPLVLSTIEELSAREVGAVLGISEALVRQRTLRARELLRAKLAALLEHHHGTGR